MQPVPNALQNSSAARVVAGETVRTVAGVLCVVAAALGGCGVDRPSRTMPTELNGPPPIPAAMLNAAYAPNFGLLTGVGPDGLPFITAPDLDPAITEARRFYDTVQTPDRTLVTVDYPDPFTGEATPMRMTAPMTLDAWKAAFGFPARGEGEALQEYRDRLGVAVYYNRNELGLGRQIGCSRFVDGRDGNGKELLGIACFVSNHGAGFRQDAAALQAAAEDTDVRNTVCITYRPTMDAGYQVQFYVYGPGGARQEWARLDTLGPRPHPHVCMTCHGGAYDDRRHLAKNARFLPVDPNLVTFAHDDAGGPTRAAQEERLRAINALAVETPLTLGQQAMMANLYPANVATEGSVATGDGVPEAWRGRAEDADFYRAVVKPYCATCHLAAERGPADPASPSQAPFVSPAAFDLAPLEAYVCNSFSMPNAQPTSLEFWDPPSGEIVVAGRRYRAAADALLARRGLDRESCTGLPRMAGCNRGTDPDALCGGAVSGGAVCDQDSGRCLPVTMSVR